MCICRGTFFAPFIILRWRSFSYAWNMRENYGVGAVAIIESLMLFCERSMMSYFVGFKTPLNVTCNFGLKFLFSKHSKSWRSFNSWASKTLTAYSTKNLSFFSMFYQNIYGSLKNWEFSSKKWMHHVLALYFSI